MPNFDTPTAGPTLIDVINIKCYFYLKNRYYVKLKYLHCATKYLS